MKAFGRVPRRGEARTIEEATCRRDVPEDATTPGGV
jgi:hypothetical protein